MKKEFGCKDYRTVKDWCENNGVQIFCDKGSRIRYVIKSEYEEAKDKEPKKYLDAKYGEKNSPEEINAKMKFYSEYRQAIDEDKRKIGNQNENYKPQGKHEKNFLSILSKIKPEL